MTSARRMGVEAAATRGVGAAAFAGGGIVPSRRCSGRNANVAYSCALNQLPDQDESILCCCRKCAAMGF
eukprot:12939211-Prorocentrum_lima.AAC.1